MPRTTTILEHRSPAGRDRRSKTPASSPTRELSPPATAGPQARQRPGKPYPDFPLFPHATGRWAKKINGRFAFFGPWGDPHGALERYLSERDELYAGRVPRGRGERGGRAGLGGRGGRVRGAGPGVVDGEVVTESAADGDAGSDLTVRDLVNHFLTAKQRRVDAGDMGPRSFNDYHRTAAMMVKFFGAYRRVDDLAATDFGKLRADIAQRLGPVALGNQVNRVRSVFKHAYEAGLLEKPMRFGPEFVRPAKRTLRLARAARGQRMFEPAEIQALLAQAGPQMKAMILLGVNCGLGNTDVASLARSNLDLRKSILDFPRPKTGIARRCVLWPETAAALKAVKAVRPSPKDRVHEDLVFITKYGQPWVRVEEPGARSKGRNKAVVKDAVTTEFGKLVRLAGLESGGRGFYALRHTFRTVADEVGMAGSGDRTGQGGGTGVGDRRAIDLIMGHESGADISNHYVERISDERLRRVVEHVRGWVFSTINRGIGGSRTSEK